MADERYSSDTISAPSFGNGSSKRNGFRFINGCRFCDLYHLQMEGNHKKNGDRNPQVPLLSHLLLTIALSLILIKSYLKTLLINNNNIIQFKYNTESVVRVQPC